ncbi:putative quinol monooxygenase [Brumimicrobium mesophilum]|uniref:putative quinol monooxygenase n=1 Tax=Brumimicrobium mesophilum TaxID=392717 RepID=UPI000D142B21|nr:antibiotic biosynthesis monooxygenase family protein [Brumimicrobium mesophilum]
MTRLVKLTLKEDKIEDFISHFDTVKTKINAFPGCKGMKLLRDKNTPGIVFTFSEWESDEDLENYRKSDLFASIWPTVKLLFDQKAEAWSTETYFDGFSIK